VANAASESANPLLPKKPHFAAKAKRVIFMFMQGAPSHVDTFDYKPQLEKDDGKTAGGGKGNRKLLKSPFAFKKSGSSGLPISEIFPHLSQHADDLCLLNSLYGDLPNHPQASVQMHTGSFQFVRPSMGAWVLYGLGTENQELPGRLTVGEYLDYLRPFYPRWDPDLERSMRRDLQLPPTRKIRDLSHGMRIKMALVCALAFRPRLLILDEPFAGLDPLVRDELTAGLLHQAGELTILISSHELSEIEGLATDIGFLHAGRLLFQEPMSRLTDRCREVYVTLESTARVPNPLPAHWLQARAVGNVLMFVETEFSHDALGELVRLRCDGVRQIDAKPMNLRSIFTTLAPAAREVVLS
jgi:ABC-2 type transport system ATP-binding protein